MKYHHGSRSVTLLIALLGAFIVQSAFAGDDGKTVAALEGSSWRMTHMDSDQPLPASVEITLSFEAGRISGNSGCNRYSAEIRDGERPGDIIIGQAMVTRKACPNPVMEIELHYLDALSLVTAFSFQAGNLALNGETADGKPFSMLFEKAAENTS